VVGNPAGLLGGNGSTAGRIDRGEAAGHGNRMLDTPIKSAIRWFRLSRKRKH
jgi:hypothetical protein